MKLGVISDIHLDVNEQYPVDVYKRQAVELAADRNVRILAFTDCNLSP